VVDETCRVESRLRDAIVDYVRAHPDASDSIEGIRFWWLPPDEREEDLELVARVLEQLVAAGAMQRRRLPDGGVVYSAKRDEEET
jgi:hypothetical protein